MSPGAYVIKTSYVNRKMQKISELMKPVVKLLSKRNRTNAVTPSTCNYSISEVEDNEKNLKTEPFQVHFTFCEEAADNLANEAQELADNLANEALEARLREQINKNETHGMGIEIVRDGTVILEPVLPGTYFATPVHFIDNGCGLSWLPLPDADLCKYGDISPISAAQLAEEQVAVCVV